VLKNCTNEVSLHEENLKLLNEFILYNMLECELTLCC
jgi:hypothetical protein